MAWWWSGNKKPIEPAEVQAAIRSDLQHFRSWELPVGRPVWFANGWQGEADGWIDSQLPSLGLQRTGPARSSSSGACRRC